MEICTPDKPATLAPAVELDRLGDEIAELSAHLDAATARLLDLIREFDARGGWNTGCRSCAAWLAWRVGLEPGAARESGPVGRDAVVPRERHLVLTRDRTVGVDVGTGFHLGARETRGQPLALPLGLA